MSPAAARRLQLALVVMAGALPYLGLLGAGFLDWDDPYFITLQPFWVTPSWEAVLDVFQRPVYGAYHPLHQVSYALDRALWGPTALGVRVTQAALHALCVGLVVALARRLGSPWFGALLAGLLFAWHPAHVENVAWLSQRKDLLSAACALAALITWVGPVPRGLEGGEPPGWGRTAGAAAWLVLGMLSKSVAVVVVPWLWLLAWRRGILRRSLSRLAPLIALGGAALLIHYRAQHALGAAVSAPPLLRHAQRLLHALAYYLQTAVAPLGLSPIPNPPAAGFGAADVGAAVTVLAFAAAIAVSLAGRRVFALWASWFVVALLPTLGIVPLPNFAQDRYLLLPSVGLALWLGPLGARWLRELPPARRRPARLLISGVLVLLVAGAARYAQAWRDDLSLWRWNLRRHPNDPGALEKAAYAHWKLAQAASDPRAAAEARLRSQALCQDALAIDPSRLRANLLLAEQAEAEGRFADMRPLLERALSSGSNAAYQAGLRLCSLELREDDLEAAADALAQGERLAPAGAPEVAAGHAALDLARGRLDAAAEQLQRAVAALPEWRAGWANLALVERLRGDPAAARSALARARPDALAAAVEAQVLLDAGETEAAAAQLVQAGVSLEAELARVRVLHRRGQPTRDALAALLRRGGPGARRRLALEPELRPLLTAE